MARGRCKASGRSFITKWVVAVLTGLHARYPFSTLTGGSLPAPEACHACEHRMLGVLFASHPSAGYHLRVLVALKFIRRYPCGGGRSGDVGGQFSGWRHELAERETHSHRHFSVGRYIRARPRAAAGCFRHRCGRARHWCRALIIIIIKIIIIIILIIIILIIILRHPHGSAAALAQVSQLHPPFARYTKGFNKA